MALLDVDSEHGTFDLYCEACGAVHTSLSLDPARGDLRVETRTFVVRSCPACRAKGVHTSQHLYLTVMPWDAGEGTQPGTLVGQVTDLGGGLSSIVTEHWIGVAGDEQHQRQARLIRTMQRHPLLAPHAPLHEDWLAAQQHPDVVAKREAEFDKLDWPSPATIAAKGTHA